MKWIEALDPGLNDRPVLINAAFVETIRPFNVGQCFITLQGLGSQYKVMMAADRLTAWLEQ